jgi:hypothetical protein
MSAKEHAMVEEIQGIYRAHAQPFGRFHIVSQKPQHPSSCFANEKLS